MISSHSNCHNDNRMVRIPKGMGYTEKLCVGFLFG